MDRLQKTMAQAGIGSRRKCEELIINGKVSINGVKAKIGDVVKPSDIVTVGNKALPEQEPPVYLMLYKPTKYITTVSDMYERKTVMQLLPDIQRLYPIGRLDRDAEGLLLFTNDGEFANKIMHPRYTVTKTYRVWLDQVFNPGDKIKIEKGIKLKDGFVKNLKVYPVNKKCLDISIHIGKNKIIKRIFNHFGYNVDRLKRIKIGELSLGNLKPGKYKVLTPADVDSILGKNTKNKK